MNYKDRIIILGHPRSGTGYAAWVARQYGLHIGHERLRADGISSWFWGIKDKSPPFGRGYVECPDGYKDLVIYSLRNPEDVIMSTYYTENRTKKYREKHLNHDLSGIQGAAYSYLKWFKECEKNWEGIQKIKSVCRVCNARDFVIFHSKLVVYVIDDEDDAHGWGSSSSADEEEEEGDEGLDDFVRREAEKPKLAKLKKPRSNENCFCTAAGSTAPSGEPLIRVRGKSSPCRLLHCQTDRSVVMRSPCAGAALDPPLA